MQATANFSRTLKEQVLLVLMNIDAIAGPFFNIIKVMMKGPNKRSNLKNVID